MPNEENDLTARKRYTGRGLLREAVYLAEDEVLALEQLARAERCSKSEILRRALRAYLTKSHS